MGWSGFSAPELLDEVGAHAVCGHVEGGSQGVEADDLVDLMEVRGRLLGSKPFDLDRRLLRSAMVRHAGRPVAPHGVAHWPPCPLPRLHRRATTLHVARSVERMAGMARKRRGAPNLEPKWHPRLRIPAICFTSQYVPTQPTIHID